ncbi:MAG: 2-amino-4-hydroxy-6-hydroxymethyldihydropteridine diphosphokinase [Deltaproteobacteria bacterium]|nr:2-amino-4-hydroxy-6-hydroxymethyldihydropteridine diphosphokinase [Deltaproteobacteria bacterium]
MGQTIAYIGIGSNLGDRFYNCTRAIDLMDKAPGCKMGGCSEWFWTEPVGVTGQDWYLNGVACLETGLSAMELLEILLSIERDMGRVRAKRWEARTIDLDLLIFGREIIRNDSLVVPHPRLHARRFALVPLVQIAPDLIHPGLGVTMRELLEEIPAGEQEVRPMKEQ